MIILFIVIVAAIITAVVLLVIVRALLPGRKAMDNAIGVAAALSTVGRSGHKNGLKDYGMMGLVILIVLGLCWCFWKLGM